ncbi:MAG: hypothetical protein OQK77_04920, partial [Psychromonas sp.]|nr:hypothetical protein [Psychromonas sp.]
MSFYFFATARLQAEQYAAHFYHKNSLKAAVCRESRGHSAVQQEPESLPAANKKFIDRTRIIRLPIKQLLLDKETLQMQFANTSTT